MTSNIESDLKVTVIVGTMNTNILIESIRALTFSSSSNNLIFRHTWHYSVFDTLI